MATNGEATSVGSAETAAGPSIQDETTRAEWLLNQANKVEELGVRVSSLINATADTFRAFVQAQQVFLFNVLQPATPRADTLEKPNDNQSADSTTT